LLSIRVTLLMLALGALGAVLSVGFLLLSPSSSDPSAFGRLADQQLPVMVFVAGAGFATGSLIALTWVILRRAFASASRA
jgi:hypothetical protein